MFNIFQDLPAPNWLFPCMSSFPQRKPRLTCTPLLLRVRPRATATCWSPWSALAARKRYLAMWRWNMVAPQWRYGNGSRPMKLPWFWIINIHSPAIIRVHRVPEFWLIALYPKISNALFQTLLFGGKPGWRIQLPGSIWSPSPALMLAPCSQPVAPAASTRDCWSSRSIWKTRGKASRHVVTGLQWNMVGLCWFILHKKRGKPDSYQPPPKVGLLLGLPHYMQSS